MNLENGSIINQYQILSPIGKGGMGEVFLAQDTKLDRKVAIKFLNQEFSKDAEKLSRFIQEAKAASALNHPNILTVYEIGETDDTNYIVTEFIEGKTLRDHLGHRDKLQLKQILKIGIQVAEALSAAHTAGIVHRDIKPENIMIRKDGYAKVLDFGLAKLSENKPDNASPEDATRVQVNTTPGMVMGTVSYMSPEQARGNPTDARTDIWSLGVVLYEMLAGKVPFTGETVNHTIVSILEKEPLPLENVTGELRRIVRKSLTKDVDMRYQSARDMLIDLKNLRRELDIQGELERSTVPDRDLTSTSAENATQMLTGGGESTSSGQIAATQNVTTSSSSLEYAVTKVKQHKLWYLAFAVLAVAGIGLGTYKYSGNPAIKISLETAKVARLTNSGKVGQYVAISPDGKWLVYTVVEGDQQSLWLKQVAIPDSNTQIAPPSSTIYGGLVFSPDGNYLYYNESSVGGWNVNGSLYQVPVLGGTPKKLFTGIFGIISFSPDGKQIAYLSYVDDEDRLMIANADGTDQRQLAVRRGNEYVVSGRQGPSWSPDGKTIATTIGTYNPDVMGVAAVSVATGEIIEFSPQKFKWNGDINWLADGKSLLLHGRETETQSNSLWQISYPSGDAKKISNDLIDRYSISLTAESNAFVTVQSDVASHVWVAETADSGRARQVTSGSDRHLGTAWTPDDKLVYVRVSGGSSNLFIVDPKGGSSRQLTSDTASIRQPVVSPDGRYIVFESDRGGSSTIWRIDIDGSNLRQLTEINDRPFGFSPDGREIIFVRNLNKNTVWKVSIEGGEPVQLTETESNSPQFSPDGKQFVCLFYDDPNSGGKIAIFPSAGGSPIKMISAPSTIGRGIVRWTPDGRSIAFADSKGGVGNIWTQPLDGGTPKQLTNFTSEGISSFDFSRDGKQIAISRETTTSDVVLISGIKK